MRNPTRYSVHGMIDKLVDGSRERPLLNHVLEIRGHHLHRITHQQDDLVVIRIVGGMTLDHAKARKADRGSGNMPADMDVRNNVVETEESCPPDNPRH